jgi:hypothetical protein
MRPVALQLQRLSLSPRPAKDAPDARLAQHIGALSVVVQVSAILACLYVGDAASCVKLCLLSRPLATAFAPQAHARTQVMDTAQHRQEQIRLRKLVVMRSPFLLLIVRHLRKTMPAHGLGGHSRCPHQHASLKQQCDACKS